MDKTADPLPLPELARALAALAARMGPDEAGRVRSRAGELLGRAATQTTDSGRLRELILALAALDDCPEPRVAAASLLRALEKPTRYSVSEPGVLQEIARALAAIAGCREPAAASLLRALDQANKPWTLRELAKVVPPLAARLGPGEAAPFRARAAEVLTRAMAGPISGYDLPNLAQALVVVADGQEPAQALVAFTRALEKTAHPEARRELAEGLAALADRLGPPEAARAADTLLRALTDSADPEALDNLARGMPAVAVRLERKQAAVDFTRAMARMIDPSPSPRPTRPLRFRTEFGDPASLSQRLAGVLAGSLEDLLTRPGPAEAVRRPAAVLAALSPPEGVARLIAVAPLLGLEPVPPRCRLSTPELVDLLKEPTCVGPARRVVLDQLGRRYRRPFADHRAFVRFAREQDLGLDFASPPQRLGGGNK
jgi:hypothetical protein